MSSPSPKSAWFWKWAPRVLVAIVALIWVGDRIASWVITQNRTKAKRPASMAVMRPMPDQPVVPTEPTDAERLRTADVWIDAAKDIADQVDDSEAKEVAASLRDHRDILKPNEKGAEMIKPAPSPVFGWATISTLFPTDQAKNPQWAFLGAQENPALYFRDYRTIVVKGSYPIDNKLRGLLVLEAAHASLAHREDAKPPEDLHALMRETMPSRLFSLRVIRKLGSRAFEDLVKREVGIVRADARARGYRPGDGAPETIDPPLELMQTPFPALTPFEQKFRIFTFYSAVVVQWVDEDFVGSSSDRDEARLRMLMEVTARVDGFGTTFGDAGAPVSSGTPI